MRLTKYKDNKYSVKESNYDVIEKLGKLEDFIDEIKEKSKTLKEELNLIKKTHKVTSFKYTEKYGEKLVNERLLNMFEFKGLL